MSYASKEWTENYLGQTLKTAKEQGLLGSGGGGNTLIGFEDYSEEEHVIGRWKDGKPLYRKIFKGNIAAENSYSNILRYSTTIIPISNLDTLVDVDGYVDLLHTTAGDRNRVSVKSTYMSWADTTVDTTILTYRQNEKQEVLMEILHKKTSVWTSGGRPYVLYIQYTKTTDEPDSFNNNMIASQFECTGIGYDNYSEEEVCIGKWIDGRPVYRKVVNFDITPNTNMDDVVVGKLTDYGFPNVDAGEMYIVNYETIFHGNTACIAHGYQTLGSDLRMGCRLDSRILITVRGYYVNKVTLFVYYTKTIDELNSFTPDMVYNGMIDASEATDEEVEEVFSDDSN